MAGSKDCKDERTMKILLIILLLTPLIIRRTVGLKFLNDIKEHGPDTLRQEGFEVIRYLSYESHTFLGTARVWFRVKKKEELYNCGIIKMDGVYFLSGLLKVR